VIWAEVQAVGPGRKEREAGRGAEAMGFQPSSGKKENGPAWFRPREGGSLWT